MTGPARGTGIQMTLSKVAHEQYRAVLESAGLLDCSGRGKVRVTGPDRVSFLHAMISNDVQELAEDAGRYATLLTANGRIVADFYFYKLAEEILVDLEGELAARFVTTLEKFVIMDDVTLEDAGGRWGHLSLQGPASLDVFGKAAGTEPPAAELSVARFDFGGASWLAVRKGFLHGVGVEILGPPDALSGLHGALLDEGALPVGKEVAEILRVERGIPRYGADIDENYYPMEARLDHAVSLTKGCYIGQEVVAKATHVGGVNRLLCRLELAGERLPEPPAPIFAGGKKVGTLTSAVRSPRCPRPIALGYLRRAFASPRTRVSVQLAGGEADAEVVESFRLQ